ncbi:acetyltransferase [Malaciobacter mytili]|uniref:acetyltransferase n=1 Tax=Malaciobacter mytili TaxID=603050 RepID=UPI003BB21E47
MKKVIIFGTTDFAEVVSYYLTKDPNYEVICFTLDKEYIKDTNFNGIPIKEFENIEKNFPPSEYSMFIAVGYNKMNKVREQKYIEAKNKGYELITYISPNVFLYDNVKIGDNCFIFEDNTLQPFSKIGNNTILWSGNHLGHHSIIGNNCFITSHVVIAGRVNIGNNTFIGINSTIRDNIKIGKENMIGAGSLILKNTDDYSVYSPNETIKSKVPSNRLRGI